MKKRGHQLYVVRFGKGIRVGAEESQKLLRLTAEFACASITGANFAQMIKTIDACRVSIAEFNLDSIGSHL